MTSTHALSLSSYPDRRAAVVVPAVVTTDLEIVRGVEGYVWDRNGTRYVDFAAGVGVLNFGHSDQEIIKAVQAQARELMHLGFSVAGYPHYVEVCERLVELHFGHQGGYAVLSTTGVEAVENAVKLAQAATRRPGVLVFDGGFHGRSLLGYTMSNKHQVLRTAFGMSAPAVSRAPFPAAHDDIAHALQQCRDALAGGTIGAVAIEAVQGEGGYRPAPPEFLRELARLAKDFDCVLIADEIQSGLCRTGLPAAWQHTLGFMPDITVWGKALGGGLPLSAVTGRTEVLQAAPAGSIASGTFGGNPVACAAAMVVLSRVASPDFQRKSRRSGHYLREAVQTMVDRWVIETEVRGLGGMVGVEVLDTDHRTAADTVKALVTEAQRHRLLIKSCGTYGEVLRFALPVTAPEPFIDEGVALLNAAAHSLGLTE